MKPATIAAIATPPGSGGIGIIRISGTVSRNILSSIFRNAKVPMHPGHTGSCAALESHRLYFGHIVDPRENNTVDEVLAVVMRAPRSYTTEDVVEIQSHSGYIVLNRILKLVLAHGARLAEPGEFTRRAFMNGRIDLTQAEAVVDIINARTGKSLDIATEQLKGGVGRHINEIRESILTVLAEVEAAIDFSDEVDGISMRPHWGDQLEKCAAGPLTKLVAAYENNHYFRDGIRMAIVGRPNVGKSSLLNRMTRKERAIVTETPGTTRDTIEEMVNIRGLPVIVIDTAGLHETDQQVEIKGIERTHATIRTADIVLLVVDLSQGVTSEDRDIHRQIKNTRHIIVMNKVDLKETIDLPSGWEQGVAVKVSALAGTNIARLEEAIFTLGVNRQASYSASSLVPNLRQAEGLKKVRCLVGDVLANRQAEPELIALDLRAAAGELDRILGISFSDEVLDRIFNRFCIGK